MVMPENTRHVSAFFTLRLAVLVCVFRRCLDDGQEHQPPRDMHLGEVQAEKAALPQHDKAQVQFCINLGGGETYTIDFGKEMAPPRAVFGAVNDATAMADFPHVVVYVNAGNAAEIGQTADSDAHSQALVAPVWPCSAVSIRGNDLFEGTWETVVRRSDSCNMKIKAPLAVLSLPVSMGLPTMLVLYFSVVWLYVLPLVCLCVFGGALLSFSMLCTLWVKYVCAASSRPAKVCRFAVWVMAACVYATAGLYIHGMLAMMLLFFLGLNLPIDLLLARCGIRPAQAKWPFYRMLGYQGCRVPTLVFPVELTGGRFDQV